MLGGQAEQGLERGHGRAASVEPEHELVDIVGQVFGADAVVSAEQPGLEVGEGAVDPRQLYECTFCADCVERHLANVCPNCGGGFMPRPIRPATEWRPGLSVAKRPPSARRVGLSYEPEEIARFAARIRDIPPERR